MDDPLAPYLQLPIRSLHYRAGSFQLVHEFDIAGNHRLRSFCRPGWDGKWVNNLQVAKLTIGTFSPQHYVATSDYWKDTFPPCFSYTPASSIEDPFDRGVSAA